MLHTKPDVLSLFNRIHFLKDDLFVVIGKTFCSIFEVFFFLQFRHNQLKLVKLILMKDAVQGT